MRIKKKYLMILVFLFVALVAANKITADETTRLLDAAEKRAAKMKVNIPGKTSKEGEKYAEESDLYLRSDEFMQRVEEEKKKMKGVFGINEKENLVTKIDKNIALAKNERIYVFISSSVPRSTLMSYIRDLDHLKEPNVIVCLRGFIGGMKKVRPTLDFISDLVKKDPSCHSDRCEYYQANIDIDPLAFRYFNINRVPAVAYVEGVSMENMEQSIGTPGNVKGKGVSSVVYGDMPLSYGLAAMSKKHPNLKKITRKLERRGFYHGK